MNAITSLHSLYQLTENPYEEPIILYKYYKKQFEDM